MVEVIFHIGMGKTGTTSIQRALEGSKASLAIQKTEYLGRWFDSIDAKYFGPAGEQIFFKSSPEEMKENAIVFLNSLNHRYSLGSACRFIISRESIFEHVDSFSPFVSELKKNCSVRIVVYARSPYSWLPSAYNQWQIRHKTTRGNVQPYSVAARRLVKKYGNFKTWIEEHPEIITLRTYHKKLDVVEDFAEILGVDIGAHRKRALEREGVAEGTLRAAYNNIFSEPVRPEQFNDAMGGVAFLSSPTLSEIIRDSFSYSETDKIVEENREVFNFIQKAFDVDLLHDEDASPETVSEEEVRNRLLEQLLHLTMRQADRIRRLETMTDNLQRVVEHGQRNVDMQNRGRK